MARSHTENEPEQNMEDTRHSEDIARRRSFSLSNVTEEQIRLYLLRVENYEKFAHLIRIQLEKALPALWGCRQDWLELLNEGITPEAVESLQQQLEHAQEKLAAQEEKITLQQEMLSLYRRQTATPQRVIPSVEQPISQEAPASNRRPSATPATERISESSTTRKTAKLPDPPIFTNGNDPTFDSWMRSVRNKLEANHDHYPTEREKFRYALSRVGQPASDILEPHLEEDAVAPFTSVTEVFDTLERVYGIINKQHQYRGQFELLVQGSTDFNLFVAEFHRLAAPLRRDDQSLLADFRRKISSTLQRAALGRTNDTLASFIEFCRAVDSDLKIQQQMRKDTSIPQRKTTTNATTSTANATPTPIPPKKPFIPCPKNTGTGQTARAGTPKINTNTTFAEREQLKTQGLCFLCKQPGHIAPECPQRNPRVSAVEEEQDESEN